MNSFLMDFFWWILFCSILLLMEPFFGRFFFNGVFFGEFFLADSFLLDSFLADPRLLDPCLLDPFLMGSFWVDPFLMESFLADPFCQILFFCRILFWWIMFVAKRRLFCPPLPAKPAPSGTQLLNFSINKISPEFKPPPPNHGE